jgi:hypothetical protein
MIARENGGTSLRNQFEIGKFAFVNSSLAIVKILKAIVNLNNITSNRGLKILKRQHTTRRSLEIGNVAFRQAFPVLKLDVIAYIQPPRAGATPLQDSDETMRRSAVLSPLNTSSTSSSSWINTLRNDGERALSAVFCHTPHDQSLGRSA